MLVPMVIEKTPAGERSFDIFSRLLNERIVFLKDEVNPDTASLVIAQLLHLEAASPEQDISLYIQSPGGHISAGLAIVDAMNHVKCDVSTICIGQCASMGAVLLAAGTKGKRYILPNAEVMIHQPLADPGYSRQNDLELFSDRMKTMRERLEIILADCTGQDINRIHEDCNRDHWMNAAEAKEYGLVDEILGR